MRKITLTILVLVLLIGGMTIRLYQNKLSMAAALSPADTTLIVSVDTIKVKQIMPRMNFQYVGTFFPNREIVLHPLINGAVTGVYFNEGDFVTGGKKLIQLDDELFQAQLISARANFQNAKANVERFVNASRSEGVTKAQVDKAHLECAIAESQLKQLEKNIRLCSYEAPFSGVITQKDVEVGSLAGTGPIARLSDLTVLKLKIKVPEQEIVLFKKGDKVDVISNAFPTDTLTGLVLLVSARGNDDHQFDVDISVDNRGQRIRSGSFGNVLLRAWSHEPGLYIPRPALGGSIKRPLVYLYKDGVAVPREVITGKSVASLVEIVAGLQDRDVVITSGLINIRPNCKVSAE